MSVVRIYEMLTQINVSLMNTRNIRVICTFHVVTVSKFSNHSGLSKVDNCVHPIHYILQEWPQYTNSEDSFNAFFLVDGSKATSLTLLFFQCCRVTCDMIPCTRSSFSIVCFHCHSYKFKATNIIQFNAKTVTDVISLIIENACPGDCFKCIG